MTRFNRCSATVLGTLAFMALATFSTGGTASAATTSWQVTRTINIGGAQDYQLVFDHATNTLYVGHQANPSTISAINATTGAVKATVTIGNKLQSMDVDWASRTLWAVNQADNTVSVISMNTNAVVATRSVNFAGTFGAGGVTVDQTRNNVYVTTGGRLFVFNGLAPYGQKTFVLDTSSAGLPGVDQGTGQIYVPSQSGNYVEQFASTALTSTNVNTGAAPQQVCTNSTTHTAYSTNLNSGDVTVIKGATNTAIATVSLAAGAQPARCAADAADNVVAVTDVVHNTVQLIDGATNTLLQAPLPTGALPFTLIWDAPTKSFYTVNAGSGTITVISKVTTPTITSAPNGSGTVGKKFTKTVTATGTGPITFKVTSGTLPPGLTLNATTGVISGTPTRAGSYDFTVTATNAYGTDSQANTMIVTDGIVVGSSGASSASGPIPTAVDAGHPGTGAGSDRPLQAAGAVIVLGSGLLLLTRRRRGLHS